MGRVKKSIAAKRQNIELARRRREQKLEGRKENSEDNACSVPTHASTSHALEASTLAAPVRLDSQPQEPSPHTTAAKKRRLEIHHTSLPAETTTVDDENMVLKKSYLEELFSHVRCSYCYGKLNVSFVNKFLDHKIYLECAECGNKCGDSDVKDTPVTNAMVYSTMGVGLGYAGFHKFTENMSMKPLYKNYANFQSVALEKTKEKLNEVLKKSVEAAKQHYACDKDGIYDVKVTYDGSWPKRGYTSMLAVGAVIDAETDCVLDYEVVSKLCEVCEKFSAAQAVLDYNVGYKDGFVVPLLGEPYTKIQESALERRDRARERERKQKKNVVKGPAGGDYAAGSF